MESGSSVYSAIAIYPNSGDDWSASSPFSGYTTSLAFVLGTLDSDSYVSYTRVPGKLISIDVLNKKFDLFKGKLRRIKENELLLPKVGGIADVSDLVFSIENLTSGVNHKQLIGRTAWLILGEGTTMAADSNVHVKFKGQIVSAEPERDIVTFTARGALSRYKEQKIGTLVEGSVDEYKGKMYPVIYGDMSDDASYIPVVSTIENIKLETRNLFSPPSLRAWDSLTREGFTIQGLDTNSLNNTLDYSEGSDVVTYGFINDGFASGELDTINVVNPFTCVFEFNGTVNVTAGARYTDSADNYYTFVKEDSGFHIFECVAIPSYFDELPDTGTLTLQSGTGDATLDFTWHSGMIPPDIFVEQTEDDPNNWDSDSEVLDEKANTLYIKIDDEVMQVVDVSELFFREYNFTTFHVIRGASGTSPAFHSSGSEVKNITNSNERKVKLSGYVNALTINNIEVTDGFSVSSIENCFNIGEDSPVSPFTMVLNYDGGSVARYLLFDLVFPKMELKGFVRNAHLRGYFNIANSNPDSGLGSVWYSILGLLEGGMDAPDLFKGLGYWKQRIANNQRVRRETTLLTYGTDLTYLPTIYSDFVTLFNNLSDGNQGRRDYVLKDYSNYVNANYFSIRNLNDLNSKRLGVFVKCLNSPSTDITLIFKGVGVFFDLELSPTENTLYASVKGRDDTGGLQTAGTLIENPISVLYDLLTQELSATNVDTSSFSSVYDDRTGYKLAFALFNEPKIFKDVAEEICSSAGVVLFEGSNGRLKVNTLDIPTSTSGLTDIDDTNLVVDSDKVIEYSQAYTSIDNIVTEIKARYRIRYTDDDVYTAIHNASDVGSLSDYFTSAEATLDFTREVVCNLPYVRDQVTVENILTLLAQYHYDVFRVLEVRGGLMLHEVDIGDFVTLSSNQITGSTGKVYLVVESNLQVPCSEAKPYVGLTLVEFDVASEDVIREVPSSSDEAWQETHTATDEYSEVPDA